MITSDVVKRIVDSILNGKRIDESKNLKPIRVWAKGIYGNSIIVMLTFRTFPDDKANFKIYVEEAMVYFMATGNSPRLISSEDLAAFHVLVDTSTDPDVLDFKKIHAKLADVKTSGPYWVHQLEIRSHEIEQFLLGVFHEIPESVWTDADRAQLRRPKRSVDYHDADVMEVAPDTTLRKFWHKAQKWHFHNPETPETDAMPKYQKVKFETFIGPANTVLSTIVATKIYYVTKALFTIFFQDGDVGKTLFVRATYINSVGIEGEVSTDWIPQPIV